MAAKGGHLEAEKARREAAAHSTIARERASELQNHVNDGRDEDTLKKIRQIAKHHKTNSRVQNERADHHSQQANIHQDIADQNNYGDERQRKSAMGAAERSKKAAKRGEKRAKKSYTHTDATIGFLQLGQGHLDSMKGMGRKDPDYETHRQAFRNCVDNAAEPEPSQRKLKKAHEKYKGLTNLGLLGQGSWSS